MPTIQSVQKLQFGRQISPLVKTTSLHVDSLEEFTLSVEGVPRVDPPKKQKEGKDAKKNHAAKRISRATYTPEFDNVKFVAIYNNGRGGGLRIKIGKSSIQPLTEPLIYIGNEVNDFGAKTTIILENDSAATQSVVMLVGSDLPKGARKQELIDMPSASK